MANTMKATPTFNIEFSLAPGTIGNPQSHTIHRRATVFAHDLEDAFHKVKSAYPDASIGPTTNLGTFEVIF